MRRATALFIALLSAFPVCASALEAPRCAQPKSAGPKPLASDCLFILRVAVGQLTCSPACQCAPNGTLPAKASDALLCLRSATGQDVVLACPCGPPCAPDACSQARATCEQNAGIAENEMTAACPANPGQERTDCLARTQTLAAAGDDVCDKVEDACASCCAEFGLQCTLQPEIPKVIGNYTLPHREILEEQVGLPPGPGGVGLMLLELPDGAIGFDPSARNAITSAAECASALISCFDVSQRNFAGCAAAIPTCATDEPWSNGDGFCCTPACLDRYQELRRKGRTEPAAMTGAIYEAPSCMPGVDAATQRTVAP